VARVAAVLGLQLTSAPADFDGLRDVDRIKDLTIVSDDQPPAGGWLDLAYTRFVVVAEDDGGRLHPSNVAVGYRVAPPMVWPPPTVTRTLRWTNPERSIVRVHVFREGAYVARLDGPATEWVEGSTAVPSIIAF